MYDKELEELISAALADGTVTEKEKQILFRKAQAKGIDLDEFEMVLNARISKAQQAAAQQAMPQPPVAPAAPKPQTGKAQVRKCPACGAIIPSFSTVCPDCGAELSDIQSSKALEKFTDRLYQIEGRRQDNVQEENNKKIGCGMIVAWIFLYPVFIMYYLVKYMIAMSSDPKFDGVDKSKQDLILNTPVPNSKEDLLEFMIFCATRVESLSLMKLLKPSSIKVIGWNKIWMKKLDALKLKAQIAMKNDSESWKEAQRIIGEAEEKVNVNNEGLKKFRLIGLCLFVAYILFGILVLIFTH